MNVRNASSPDSTSDRRRPPPHRRGRGRSAEASHDQHPRRRAGADDRAAPRRRRPTSRRPRARSARRCRTPSGWPARRSQEVYAGIAGEHVQAMTSKGIVVGHRRRDRQGRRRPRERSGARAGDSAGPRAAARDPAGVHGRQEHRHSRSDRHDRHAPRDGDVSRHDRQLAGDEPAEGGRARRATRCASWCSSRSRARSACSPRTRRSSASRLVEMGAGTTDLAVFHEGKIRHLGTVASAATTSRATSCTASA